MVKQLAEGQAVLIPAALWSPGGHFPCSITFSCDEHDPGLNVQGSQSPYP